jgi:hypothetical protein
MLVAAAASAALGHEHPLAVLVELACQNPFLVSDDGAGGDGDDAVVALLTVARVSLAVGTILAAVVNAATEHGECVETVIALEPYTSTVAPIASARSAKLDAVLSPHCHASVTTFTTLDINFGYVEKLPLNVVASRTVAWSLTCPKWRYNLGRVAIQSRIRIKLILLSVLFILFVCQVDLC